jgi:hypothetical protein
MVPLLPDDPFLKNQRGRSQERRAESPDRMLFSSSPVRVVESTECFYIYIVKPAVTLFWLVVPIVLCWLTTVYYLQFGISMPYPTRWIGMQIFCVFAAGCCFMSFLIGMIIDASNLVGAQFKWFRRIRDRVLFRRQPEHAFYASDYQNTFQRHDYDWYTPRSSFWQGFVKFMIIMGKSFLFACTLFLVFISTQGALLFFPVPIPITPFPDPTTTPLLDSVTVIFAVIMAALAIHTWIRQWGQTQSKRQWFLWVIFHLFFMTGTFGFYMTWRFVGE